MDHRVCEPVRVFRSLGSFRFGGCSFYGNYGSCIPCANPTKYTETHTYHPAGAPTSKTLTVTQRVQDDDGNLMTNSAKVAVNYTYDTAGRMATSSSSAYTWSGSAPITLSYSYDTMGRLWQMTDNSGDIGNPAGNISWAKNPTYDLAGRMTGVQRYLDTLSYDCADDDLTHNYLTEWMAYNVNGQLTSKNYSATYAACYSSWSVNNGIQYNYSLTQNNGQITQMVDAMSGETVSYSYDALKRLISASSTPTTGSSPAAWTQTFGYDGFGNLTSKVLNSGSNSIPWAVDPATNRFGSGSSYDLNGNLLSGPGVTLSYDEANRVASVASGSGGTQYYTYSPDNKRIFGPLGYSGAGVSLPTGWTFYGAYGEKLGSFYWYDPSGTGDCYVSCQMRVASWDIWLAGRLIFEGPSPTQYTAWAVGYGVGATYPDRIGTNRAYGSRFYPYGEEITSTANNHEKFGTYTRDSFSGLDYADQRYYASSYGRFNTADPYRASAGPSDPGSWNRYSYTRGDPVNRYDPRGLADWSVDVTDTVDPVEGNMDGGIGRPGAKFEIDQGYGDPPTSTPVGGIGNPNAPKVTSTDQAHSALQYELANLTPNCDKVLPVGALKGSEGFEPLQFWDARSQGNVSAVLLGSSNYTVLPDGSTSTTLSSFFTGSIDAVTLTNGSYTTNQVVLGPDFFNADTPGVQGVTLLHELLHFVLQKGDADIAAYYGISVGVAGASASFESWLLNDCNNK